MPGTQPDQTAIQALEARLRAMEASTSWRITAPLRWLADLSRGVRGNPRTYDRPDAARIFAPEMAPASSPPDASGARLAQLAPTPRQPGETIILILDHAIPKPDHDAGSRAIMDVILSLRTANWQVLFWPQDRRWDEIYTAALERLGVRVLDDRVPILLPQWLQAHGAALDHVMVSRASVAECYALSVAARTAAQLTFYGHDIASARIEMQAELTGDPELREEAQRYLSLERRLWRLFDRVVYLSAEEAASVRRLEPQADVRSVVPFAYDDFIRRDAPPEGAMILFVGGFAHAPNRDAAEFLVRDILPLVQANAPEVTIVLAGSHPGTEIRALASPSVTVTGWLSDTELTALYNRCRVAAVPLRFGAGVKGKVLEALQHGLPTVVTPVGAQGLPELDTVAPIFETAEGFACALLTLLRDDTAWIAQSAAQTAYICRRFSRTAMRDSVLAAFEPAPQPARDPG